MRKVLQRSWFVLAAVGIAWTVLFFCTPILGVTSGAADASLRAFLQNYLRRPYLSENETTYLNAWFDLNSDGKQEAIVYLIGRNWCGSGGCTTLILEPQDSSYRLITKIKIARPPISVLTTSSHGWHTLTVWVQGGGVQPGYEAELLFDGKTYPTNPSVPPAHRLAGETKREVAIQKEDIGKPLYP
jgi:hypothetical protein